MGKTKHHYNNQTLIAPTQLKITELRIPKIYSEKYMYCLPNNRYPLVSIRYVQLYYEPIAKKFLKDVSQKQHLSAHVYCCTHTTTILCVIDIREHWPLNNTEIIFSIWVLDGG